jgi:hypothetical protein
MLKQGFSIDETEEGIHTGWQKNDIGGIIKEILQKV